MEVQCPVVVDFPVIPQNSSIADYVLGKVGQYGESIAMIDADTDKRFHYSEIIPKVGDIVQNLLHKCPKLSIQSRIMVIAQNCPEMVLIELACSFLGVDSGRTSPFGIMNELVYQMSASGATHLIWQAGLTENAHKFKSAQFSQGLDHLEHLFLEDLTTEINKNKKFASFADLNAFKRSLRKFGGSRTEAPKEIFFSSGTTGLPKAIETSQDALVQNFQQLSCSIYRPMTAKDRTILFLPFHHMYPTLVLFTAISCGSMLVSMSKYTLKGLLQNIQRYKITIMHTVPPVMYSLATERDVVKEFNLSSLESIISAGAPLNPNLGAEFRDRHGIDVRQLYGLTESSGGVTWTVFGSKNVETIGQPLPGIKIKVCDPDTGGVFGPNQLGELCIYRDIARPRYHGKPEETDKLFDSQGYLKTGDIGYYDNLGYLYVVDRCKEMIKYKGTPVAPTEVEIELRKHPGVADCAVVGKPDNLAGELPAAFVVKSLPGHEHLTDQDLNDFLKGKLSSYKQLRGGVYFIDEIPRSASGKILRRILKEKYFNTRNSKL